MLVVGILVLGLVGAAPDSLGAPPRSAPATDADLGPTVYVGQLTPAQVTSLGSLGLDREDLTAHRTGTKVAVEVVLSRVQAAKLQSQGVPISEKKVDGATVTQRMTAAAASGYTVFRSYSEPGGIRDELIGIARQYPRLTKLVSIGRTVQGHQILAIKLTKDATRERDGSRPSVLYSAAQHAREWITPEMDRRLLHYYLDHYATDRSIRRIVDSTELWFVPVANPDGYDYTFTPGNRLWRKNLRDNDGDGRITGVDGVDPNRNFPYRWDYDNEGSSSSFASDTYRGTAAASEPETRALDGLMRRIRFEFQINYHSAAELLLYGVGWQVATPTPDDAVYEALAGDDANPAVPGYDPDISAELYTTNGETTEHAHNTYGTLAFTPEMSTCETASAVDPDDAFDPADCESGFNFPDSEALIQAEFEKNIPFALSVAKSAHDPSNPVSALGLTVPDFQVHSFAVSYGDPQPVAVVARRDLRELTMHYSINGGRTRSAGVREWKGGERYGFEQKRYYAEYRGQVHGARPGDTVKVWFTGKRAAPGHRSSQRTSESFRYQLASDSHAKVLVLANEDYKGVNPTYPASVTAPKYAASYTSALHAQGLSSIVYDVDKYGVPDHLGVLGHFKAVVWYLGDNRLTQDARDQETEIFGDNYPDAAVAKRAQDLTMSVRDYLNEGGKLVHTGETAQYYGILEGNIGGIYYGLNGDPSADCVVVSSFDECLFVADDFSQYYLGAYSRAPVELPTSVLGSGRLAGVTGAFGGPAIAANPLDEAGTFTPTSAVLPPEEYPQFASAPAAAYQGISGGAYDPVEGNWYAGAIHIDDSYARLARTVDLTGVQASAVPTLRMQLSYSTEPGYDHVILEAHTVGADDWTTLPEVGGATSTDVPADCEQGFLLDEHPFLAHYLTLGDPCAATGSSGAWNSFTGDSGGWQPVAFDLSGYAGKQVEVSITFVTDPSFGAVGVFVDDTEVVAGGTTLDAEGFEAGLGAWSVQPPPVGSYQGGSTFVRSQALLAAGVSTRDTVLLGFGIEQLATPAERAAVLGKAVRSLIR